MRVAYLIGYYVDNGPVVWCDILGFPAHLFGDDPCDGHYGDSEAIFLDVVYNAVTQHWVLNEARFSAHFEYNFYTPLASGYPNLYYPEKRGGYPRAWVAFSKHANYRSDGDCDRGGTAGSDNWMSNTSVRLLAGGNLDIGSRAVHTSSQDCVASSNQVYSTNGVTECYWTYKTFTGWSGAIPDASSYTNRLSDMGF